ncbi:MAG TPA: caspase family protein, partial [Steroidobacteraceae bacterium]|nr:caspase family protein [Steroidobacteraceae bacterium]
MRASGVTVLVLGAVLVAAPDRAEGAAECTPLPRDPGRIALVLGNAAYRSSPPLPNAANDARAVHEVLEHCLGFTVLIAHDLARDAIVQQVREFAGRLVPGGVALFYYAGHGVEQDGRNYLIPAIHRIRSRADIPVEAYPIDDVVKRMEAGTGEGGVNIVIVDACRDNPLPALPGEGRSFGWRSLAPVETQSGTLVMHSTRSGAQALDQIPGTQGTNSPFTIALLTQIVRADITLRDLPYEVTADVRRLTERVQEPWSSASYVPPIRLAAGGGSLVIERPVPGTQLRVTSLPSGAQVTIDGRAVGTAPLDAVDVQPGEVLVRATLAGHEPAEARLTLRAGMSHEVQLVLTAIARMVRLTVDAQPAVATIRIVGGPSYQPGIELPVGDYVLEVSAPGYQSHRETIRLARADQRVVVRLTRALGAAARATAREITGLPAASSTWALAVNAAGIVLGATTLEAGPQVGFTWSATRGMRALEAAGGLGSVPAAINEAGDVAGTASNARGEPRATIWSAAGRVRELPGLPAGQWSSANAINSAGDIAGAVVRPGAFSSPLGGHGAGQRAFMRRANGAQQWLHGLGGEAAPAGMNERGDVVGWSHDRAGNVRAVLWSDQARVRDLGTLGGATSAATAINGAGVVVGWAENTAGQKRAFRWHTNEGMTDLGTLGGAQSQAMAINDVGWIVGVAHDDSGQHRAFLWRPDNGMT